MENKEKGTLEIQCGDNVLQNEHHKEGSWRKIINFIGEDKYFEVIEEGDEIIVIISYDDREEAENFVKNVESNAKFRGKVKSVQAKAPDTASLLHLTFFILFLSVSLNI